MRDAKVIRTLTELRFPQQCHIFNSIPAMTQRIFEWSVNEQQQQQQQSLLSHLFLLLSLHI